MQTSTRNVSAFFDTEAAAMAAADRIAASGVDRDSITIVRGNTEGSGESYDNRGFFEKLGDFFMPDEDRAVYSEGLARGGYLLSLTVDAAHRDDVLDILDDEGTVNLDEREASYRAEGWGGYDESYRAGAAPVAGSAAVGAGTGAVSTDDDKIDVVEERLRVGKREVDHGRVRVRSYMVEEPVEEDVTLRDQRVTLERTPVNRPADGTETLGDVSISAEEHSEEAVVSKEARVVEELRLRTEEEERTETVRDTVRHTEVEVEDDRGGRTDALRR